MRRWLALALAAGLAACSAPRTQTLTVSAAASLQDALTAAANLYRRQHRRVKVDFNFGGSGALEQQIEAGAPVDLFLSAAPQPMDRLAARGLIRAETRRDLLYNQVVLIAPRASILPQSFADLANPRVRLLALGDPASVPAGEYGKQVLTALDLWQRVQPRLVLAKDVRQVLGYVETGNADAGIVYATDARQSHNVRVAAVAPPATHTPVLYPVAVLRAARYAAAAVDFAAFLGGPQARAIFAAYGFTAAAP